MTSKEKIDIIFSKVARIETSVAVMAEKDDTTEKRLNSQEGKLAAIDEVILAYKTERAKIIGGAVASGAIIGAVISFLFWVFGIKNH